MSIKFTQSETNHDEIMKWGFNNENEFNYPLTHKEYDILINHINNFDNKSKSDIQLFYSIRNNNEYERFVKVKEKIVEIVSHGTYQDIVHSHGHVLDGGKIDDPYIMCVRLKVIKNVDENYDYKIIFSKLYQVEQVLFEKVFPKQTYLIEHHKKYKQILFEKLGKTENDYIQYIYETEQKKIYNLHPFEISNKDEYLKYKNLFLHLQDYNNNETIYYLPK